MMSLWLSKTALLSPGLNHSWTRYKPPAEHLPWQQQNRPPICLLFFIISFCHINSTTVGGKLHLQHSYKINCVELILISWNFMRLCYSWADAAPLWLNSSSCGLHRPHPKRRWSGSNNGWLDVCDTLIRPRLLIRVTRNPLLSLFSIFYICRSWIWL